MGTSSGAYRLNHECTGQTAWSLMDNGYYSLI